mgnify:CR=1 FL=1
MKRLSIGVIAILTVLTLGAYSGYETGSYVQNGQFEVIGNHGRYDILRDVETGCQYLEPMTDRGLTPFYDKDGEVKGCTEVGE